jgi:hypothetical protein
MFQFGPKILRSFDLFLFFFFFWNYSLVHQSQKLLISLVFTFAILAISTMVLDRRNMLLKIKDEVRILINARTKRVI